MVRIVRNLAEVRILIAGKAQILSIAGLCAEGTFWYFGQVSLFATSEFVRRLDRNDIECVNQ